MVEVGRFVGGLKAAGVEFFTGVPDSLLKSLLRVCDGHVWGEPRDRRERGRCGWIGGLKVDR